MLGIHTFSTDLIAEKKAAKIPDFDVRDTNFFDSFTNFGQKQQIYFGLIPVVLLFIFNINIFYFLELYFFLSCINAQSFWLSFGQSSSLYIPLECLNSIPLLPKLNYAQCWYFCSLNCVLKSLQVGVSTNPGFISIKKN